MVEGSTIFAPVSIYDVKRVLGHSSNDLATLCRLDNINKWARYKPVAYQGFPIRGGGDATFDAKTGLNVGAMIDTPSSVAEWDDVVIDYTKPTGSMTAPYRLTDFVEYEHNAQAPISTVWRSFFKMNKAMTCTVSIFDRTSEDQYTRYISFSDVINEISGYSGFKNADKRLCLATIDVTNGGWTPVWYNFSEVFASVGSSGTWTVSNNMNNSSFTSLLTIGHTYKFVVMIVNDIAPLTDVVSGTDRYVWEYGVSPSVMADYESNYNMLAMSMAFESGIETTTAVLQSSSVISDMTYTLDVLSISKFGDIVASGAYNILCTEIILPNIIVDTPELLNSSAQYQMRVAFSQGSDSATIFKPTDGDGSGNYYEIESSPSTSMNAIAVSPWVRASDIGAYTEKTDGDGNVYYEYEFDFYNRSNIILSRTAEQTSGESEGLFLFFDQEGATFDFTFSLYYKANSSSSEVLVRTFTVTYYIANGGGNIHDVEF